MIHKLLKLLVATAIVAVCLPSSEAGPAYPGSTFNSWDTQPPPQQTQNLQQRRTPPGQKRTLQSAVRQHMDDLDKQTQNDLKVLGYLEKELNKIFSCYIKLSCPRMRSPKVLSECDEIKDWPLYHQVMKMAGIRKYPYQNYAPPTSPRRLLATTEIPEMNQDEDTTTAGDLLINNGDDQFNNINNNNDEDDEVFPQPQRSFRQRPNRRIRRGSKNQQHHHQHHLHGAPVTNDDDGQ